MLFELEPGKEITGGTWYSDQQEFDHALINALREAGQHGQSGRLGGATASHHGLLRLHLKA